jgi:hypothetical protein
MASKTKCGKYNLKDFVLFDFPVIRDPATGSLKNVKKKCSKCPKNKCKHCPVKENK